MIDRRDFDEWWGREQARNRADLPEEYRYWAEVGFMAAAQLMAQLMAQAMREQKARARDAQRPAAILMRDMLRAAEK